MAAIALSLTPLFDEYRMIKGSQPLRVMACMASLEPGGAQRAMTALCSWLAAQGHRVTLVTLDPADYRSFYPLAPEVEWQRLALLGGAGVARAGLIVARLRALRKAVKAARPDVVLSFIDVFNILAILATRGLGIPIIVSERTDPSKHAIGELKSALRRWIYSLADRVVAQTERVAGQFPPNVQRRIEVIPGSIPAPAAMASPERPGPQGRFRIAFVGRLERSKAVDFLISAFARLAERFPDWDLVIYGDGPERARLVTQVESLGLGARISLPGLSREIPAELAASHLFAFPSHYEGFSNALGEAVAAGLPAVAFREVSGNEELVAHGETGYLVDRFDDLPGFAEAMAALMGDHEQRGRFGRAARERAQCWLPEVVHQRWEALLEEVAGARGAPVPKRVAS